MECVGTFVAYQMNDKPWSCELPAESVGLFFAEHRYIRAAAEYCII